MKEYMEKLYHKLHEAMEKPVTLGSAEEVGLYAKTICRLEKLHGHHDEPETATFDRETAMQWAAHMQNAMVRPARIGRWNRQRPWPRAWAFSQTRSHAGRGE